MPRRRRLYSSSLFRCTAPDPLSSDGRCQNMYELTHPSRKFCCPTCQIRSYRAERARERAENPEAFPQKEAAPRRTRPLVGLGMSSEEWLRGTTLIKTEKHPRTILGTPEEDLTRAVQVSRDEEINELERDLAEKRKKLGFNW